MNFVKTKIVEVIQMAKIKPFKAYRPKKGVEHKLASYPYDVINSKEARELAKDNEYSFLHVVKPEIDLEPDIDLYDEKVYQKGAENLKKFIENGILIQDKKPCFYIYSQEMNGRRQTGLVCLASAIEYDNNLIKKHEHTRIEKVKDRTKHIQTQRAHAGPVFLTYKAVNSIENIIKEIQKNPPEYDVTFDDGIRHILWVVDNDEVINNLIKEFEKVECLYIADGHHRSESAAETYRREKSPETEGFLAVLFPDKDLYIMDYNRVVKDLNGLTKDEFLKKVSEKFEISPGKEGWDGKPDKRHTFGMYLDGKWYKLTAKPEFIKENDPVRRLDSYILQQNLLAPVLGIENPRTSKRIDFIGGIRGMKELVQLVDSGKYKVAFSMFPTSIKELMDIADAGEVMPPKSTWFEPKLRSGFMVNIFRNQDTLSKNEQAEK